jgi:mono/diheme cytochrome c family protein
VEPQLDVKGEGMKPRVLMTLLTLGASLVTPVYAAEDGAAIFKAQCAKCHGETGESDTPASKALKVPMLKGDAKVGGMSVDDIVKSVKANEKHKSFVTKLTDEQITAAAGFAKQLAGGK